MHSDNSKVVYNFTNSTLSNNYSDGVYVIDVVNEPFYSINDFWRINNNSLVDLTTPISSKQSERGNLLSKEVFSTESSTAPIHIESNTYNSGGFLSKDYL
ncbi:MAG: hypothetical protein PHR40_08600, partial [Bacteroidales bacterium]|nr:hypothetical protein [Bacteroidales bacterium]